MKIFSLIAIFFVLSSCASLKKFGCPYEISEADVFFDNDGSPCAKICVFNGAEKAVKSMTVSFVLYDSNGSEGTLESESIIEVLGEDVLAGEERRFLIPLEKYVSGSVDGELKIGFLFLREIIYEDGRRWRDGFGKFALRDGGE